ncbi:hypothetical protein Goari_009947 [Gossypium aridum]|uniref:Uncharacterized protein n=1 Tax=Gossypium aridum TaxID=34290 RepID=A0A7J8Y041_GOSAI|nr:hypothetical protein [Gossypium aridum]
MFPLHNHNRLIQIKLILHFQRRRKRVLRLANQFFFYFTYRCCHVIGGKY